MSMPLLTMSQFRAELARILGCGVGDLPPVFAGTRPRALRVGILHDLTAAYPYADAERLRQWLGRYTSTRAYQQAVLYGEHRHTLQGWAEGWIGGKAKRRARQRLAILNLARSDCPAGSRPERDGGQRPRASSPIVSAKEPLHA